MTTCNQPCSVHGALLTIGVYESAVTLLGISCTPGEVPQQPLQMVPELDAHKHIEDGVEAAVGEGNQATHIKHVVHLDVDVTVGERLQLPVCQRLQEQGHIIGCPAQEEDHNNDEDESNGLVPGMGVWPKEPQKDLGVAKSNDGERDQEKNIALICVHQLPSGTVIFTM